MSSMWLLFFIALGISAVVGKKDPVCVEPLDGVAAYPCESRPSKEPLSLQYSKAQSTRRCLVMSESNDDWALLFS